MNKIKCEMVDNVGSIQDGKYPCELCSKINKLSDIVNDAERTINELESIKVFKQLSREYLELVKIQTDAQNKYKELLARYTQIKINKEKLPQVVAFKTLKAEFTKLNNSHKKCAGCGLCFGGNHIALEFRNVPELKGDVCQYCASDIDEHGLEEFIERVKRAKKEESKNI